jgi:sulfite reductase (NADPH) hemoprotein beta-component
MRVYNMHGRRDNLYKARIKILVHALGAEEFARQVKEEFAKGGAGEDLKLPDGEIERNRAYFAPPAYESLPDAVEVFDKALADDKAFAQWARTNLADHKVPGYAIVNISLKPIGGIAGDATADQMDAVADIAETFSLGEIRVTHEQNLVLPDVKKRDLYEVWKRLDAAELATPNIGLISDMIVCPGLDYCDLANARSISIGQAISERFADLDREYDIGELKIKISGCINACGHHHVGHIGILGVDKKGVENYQVTLGGSANEDAAVGDIVGPAFTEDRIVDAIETIVETYVANRKEGESFLACYRRIGIDPFKETLYAAA